MKGVTVDMPAILEAPVATLRKGLGFVSSTAIAVNTVAILVDVIIVYGQGLISGGPVVIFWGFIVSFAMTMLVAFCLAEISSAYPVSGSVYSWSAQVVPSRHSALASYTCGWMYYFGVVATKAVLAAVFAGLTNAAVHLSTGTSARDDQVVGIAIATLYIWAILNVARIDEMAVLNIISMVFNVATSLLIVIAVLAVPKQLNSPNIALFEYHNETGFKSSSYVTAIGLIVPAYCFLEYDASALVVEETLNGKLNAPRGIIATVFMSGVCGLCLFVALLFATVDLDAVVFGRTEYAIVNLLDLYLSHTWAVTLSWLLVINVFFAGVTGLGVNGRIALELARDKALPFSSFFARINTTFQSPVNAIFFTAFCASLFLLLLFDHNAAVAFESLVGLAVIGIELSYALPIFLKLVYCPADFPHSAYSLGGYSRPLGVIACIWLVGISIIGFMPTEAPINARNMNWAVVVALVYGAIGAVNWILSSRHSFKGPARYSESLTPSSSAASADKSVAVEVVENRLLHTARKGVHVVAYD